ncbi:MAG TPA: glycosyltransferase family 4 protein [Thermomicrobiales bacterium]|jgi:glycosyltransferase involved in cell wall biosynthesis|nr:glycosyltransferase family 4 protein [Thermomicrobiales bacterium]
MTTPVPRIAIVGGIFDRSAEYQAQRRFTPESVLVDGLRSNGWDAFAVGHGDFDPGDRWDLVHVHHIGRAALRMAFAGGRAPFVYTSHDPYLASDYEVNGRRRTMTGLVAARADVMIPLSEAERARDERRFGSRLPKQVVIPNGFPSATYHYAPPPDASDTPRRPTVLFVGQLIPFKGVDVLLHAFADVDPEADLLLAYQNAALEADYRARAERLGIADRVRFLGIQSSAQLADHYRAADVLVSASYAEALPSVVIEALMCGCPVIATDVGGVPDILAGQHLTVPAGDATALAAALRTRLANPVSGADRAATSADAIARYTPEAMVAAHETVYRDLLAAGRVPRRSRRPTRVLHPAVSFLLDRAGPLLAGRGLTS